MCQHAKLLDSIPRISGSFGFGNILDLLMTSNPMCFHMWLAKRGIKKTNGIPATRISDLTLGLEPKPKGYTGRMGPMGEPEETRITDNGGKNEVCTYNIQIKCWSVVNVVNEIVLTSGWPWRQRG